jgi:hypothetical protein
MTLITLQDAAVVMRDGKVGTEQACCCGKPCTCRCLPGANINGVFLSPDCKLQKIIVDFDCSQLGPCTGNFTVEVTENDQDDFFPFSKRVQVDTPGGSITLSADLFCADDCIVLLIEVYSTFLQVDGGCYFCGGNSDFNGRQFTLFLNGTTDEEGVCCPVGGNGVLGPNMPYCGGDVQLSMSATCVY